MRSPLLTLLLLVVVFLGACSEPECPDGFNKVGKSCLRVDAGTTEGGSIDPAEAAPGDGGLHSTSDASQPDSNDAQVGLPPDGSASDSSAPASTDSSVAIDDGGGASADPDANEMSEGGAGLPDSAVDAQTSEGAPDTPCEPNPCQHAGLCTVTPQGPSCNCGSSGYEGARCETDIDECAQPNVCTNPAYPCAQTEPPGYTCLGQFADWPMPDKTTFTSPSYDTTTIPGIAIDKVTGLDWERSPPRTYTRCTGKLQVDRDSCTWDEAQDYCDRLILAGLDDWRLPSKIELESIGDLPSTMTPPPVQESDPFLGPGRSATFWTRSPRAADPKSMWIVSLALGHATRTKEHPNGVRCVRTRRRPASGTPESHYTVNTNGTVRDNRTGILWQATIPPALFTLDEAYDQCKARGQGWELPTVKQLLTLVDPAEEGAVAIDNRAFPQTPEGAYWTDHTVSDGTTTFHAVLMLAIGVTGSPPGHIWFMEETKPHRVRCARP